jgi:hypothetical protein
MATSKDSCRARFVPDLVAFLGMNLCCEDVFNVFFLDVFDGSFSSGFVFRRKA